MFSHDESVFCVIRDWRVSLVITCGSEYFHAVIRGGAYMHRGLIQPCVRQLHVMLRWDPVLPNIAEATAKCSGSGCALWWCGRFGAVEGFLARAGEGAGDSAII